MQRRHGKSDDKRVCECVYMGRSLKSSEKKKAGVGVCVFMCVEEVVLEFQLPTLPVPFLLFTWRSEKEKEGESSYIVPPGNEDQIIEGDFKLDSCN